MNIKSNIEYFNISINNKEGLDTRYMTLKTHKLLDEIVMVSKKIKDILITIKELNAKNLNADIFYDELFTLITTENGSKNEFNCFLNACDLTISVLKENKSLLMDIVALYFNNRNISEHTPKEWVQALIDKGAQRTLGNNGENKVLDILKQHGYTITEETTDFFNFDYSATIYNKETKNKICRSIDFGSQNKDLDIIIKAKNKYFFLEAKHIKEGGGAQDKQIKELIQLMEIELPNNIYLISFMDGVYSNKILNLTNEEINNPELITKKQINKLKLQQHQIVDNLKINNNSFWVNTYGLIELIKDLKSN